MGTQGGLCMRRGGSILSARACMLLLFVLLIFSHVPRAWYLVAVVGGISFCRGEHFFAVGLGGLGRCVTCLSCAVSCPALAFAFLLGAWLARSPVHVSISWFRCIFCGLCDLVCPVACIGLAAFLYHLIGVVQSHLIGLDRLVFFFCSLLFS